MLCNCNCMQASKSFYQLPVAYFCWRVLWVCLFVYNGSTSYLLIVMEPNLWWRLETELLSETNHFKVYLYIYSHLCTCQWGDEEIGVELMKRTPASMNWPAFRQSMGRKSSTSSNNKVLSTATSEQIASQWKAVGGDNRLRSLLEFSGKVGVVWGQFQIVRHWGIGITGKHNVTYWSKHHTLCAGSC